MNRFNELKKKFPGLIPIPELRANVSIIELAVQYGYQHLPRKGQSRPVLKHPAHGDTIIIKNPADASQQLYQRADDFADSGTIIDFIRNRLSTVFSVFNHPGQHELRNVTNVLYDYLKIDTDQIARNRTVSAAGVKSNPRQLFAKELFDIRPLEKDNYLLRRHIDPRIIDGPEFKGKAVTQVTYLNTQTSRTEDFLTVQSHPERNYLQFHNVAFPYYNGLTDDVMGFEIRNDNLKQHAPGSDRYASVFISNIPPIVERFVVLESVLDAMAHRQLRSLRDDDGFDTVYFSTGGQLTPEQINTISRYVSSLEKAPNWKIELAFDNDVKGHRYDLQFIQQLTAPQFPITSTVATDNRLGLVLPETKALRPLWIALLNRAERFNTQVRSQFEPVASSNKMTQKERSSQLIQIGQLEKQTVLYLPETSSALHALSSSLLELTGLSKWIEITKAHGNDFSDELKAHKPH